MCMQKLPLRRLPTQGRRAGGPLATPPAVQHPGNVRCLRWLRWAQRPLPPASVRRTEQPSTSVRPRRTERHRRRPAGERLRRHSRWRCGASRDRAAPAAGAGAAAGGRFCHPQPGAEHARHGAPPACRCAPPCAAFAAGQRRAGELPWCAALVRQGAQLPFAPRPAAPLPVAAAALRPHCPHPPSRLRRRNMSRTAAGGGGGALRAAGCRQSRSRRHRWPRAQRVGTHCCSCQTRRTWRTL